MKCCIETTPVAGIAAAPVAHRYLVLQAGGGERSKPPHGHAKPGAGKTGIAESPAATLKHFPIKGEPAG